jgi:hypothetical protein
VTDFVKLGPWPIFNLADACIVVGIIILIVLFFLSSGKESPLTQPSGQYLYTPSEESPVDRPASSYREQS